jgi:hypothetical protein
MSPHGIYSPTILSTGSQGKTILKTSKNIAIILLKETGKTLSGKEFSASETS